MTNNSRGRQPEFKPGDVVWHVRHGKVTLGINEDFDSSERYPVWCQTAGKSYSAGGKEYTHDVGRVLYTLDEARQYGWLPKEPRVVEFETKDVVRTESDRGDLYGVEHPLLEQFLGKRVKVRVSEILEDDDRKGVEEVIE